MNNLEEKEILGCINMTAETKDFHKEYTKVSATMNYCMVSIDGYPKMGCLLVFDDRNLCVNVPVQARSFLNLKYYSSKHTRHVQPSGSVVNSLTNFYDINTLLAFVKDVDNNFFDSYIIFEKDKNPLSLNVVLTDILCFSCTMSFPIYVNNYILDKRGCNYDDIKSRFKEIGVNFENGM